MKKQMITLRDIFRREREREIQRRDRKERERDCRHIKRYDSI